MMDKLFHGGLLVLTLVYWLIKGPWREHFWENVLPWVVMLALMVVRDAIVSGKALWREVSAERQSQTRETGILSPWGKPTTVVIQPESGTHDGIKILGIIAALSILMLGLICLTWRQVKTADTPSAPPQTGLATPLAPTEIYMGCTNTWLPIHIGANSVAHVKVLNKKQFMNTGGAMDDIYNDGTKERLWPDAKTIGSGPKVNPGKVIYKCDVTNHASTNLIDLAIPLTTNFENDKTRFTYSAVISPLDAGATFSFYLINECPVGVSVVAGETATVQVFGEDKRRDVPLHWSRRNPIEQILGFFPSPVRWTGNACE